MSTTHDTSEAIELTILMPCLNEAETLASCIKKALAFVARTGIVAEVVIADNGSDDGSIEIAERLGARVVHVTQRGYGAALFRGCSEARGRYIVIGDSDDSYDFSAIDPFVQQLRKGYDLVIGNRFTGGILPGAMPWKNRYLGNPVLSWLGRTLFRTGVRDFHCGLRGLSHAAFLRMELRTAGMEFASEMVIKATLLGMRVAEVPTRLHPDGRSRPPHLRPWSDGWRHLRFMFLYSPRWLFLYPGIASCVLGGALMVRLQIGPIYISAVGFDVHTMLYAGLMVLLGFQGIVFAAFSRVFADLEGLTPESSVLNGLFRYVNLERGLLLGLLLLVGGVAGTMSALKAWGLHEFGMLDARVTLRAVIPSVVALALGVQVLLASLFLSMLGLRLRRRVMP